METKALKKFCKPATASFCSSALSVPSPIKITYGRRIRDPVSHPVLSLSRFRIASGMTDPEIRDPVSFLSGFRLPVFTGTGFAGMTEGKHKIYSIESSNFRLHFHQCGSIDVQFWPEIGSKEFESSKQKISIFKRHIDFQVLTY